MSYDVEEHVWTVEYERNRVSEDAPSLVSVKGGRPAVLVTERAVKLWRQQQQQPWAQTQPTPSMSAEAVIEMTPAPTDLSACFTASTSLIKLPDRQLPVQLLLDFVAPHRNARLPSG
ncbi:hypothetical protein GOP47_0025699 [Adiantum capillus-veneris]|uniref:Uncharacterized protein n=1 Tax=Adiantum capillus-veneris TaxID=13818 RepID=A0A9D4Z356_ADICA|nr:hypothetical protein GOP47_0025699 [Adiantum capillus-veneris]